MFHEVKVLDRYGNIKRIISSRELSRTHWRKFQKLENQLGPSRADGRVPRWVKQELDLEFSEDFIGSIS
ncbi:MAG: hypothetical protein GWM98_04095 [Nitrospinaceae bacterium]|nr:hypothetical protein [Nitrospinaceae bacterium]NIR53838.1 hypothetical protein [Nitrospinaceae bacterium]NIS84249.1 hypothetical protein [Nitrospinaceae bacterium]NIT81053.1 hypothetical protein [Nitrospinaceae bacterium]NIU43344.1 hypothetical protein [Nitrospinaceae bacterium]